MNYFMEINSSFSLIWIVLAGSPSNLAIGDADTGITFAVVGRALHCSLMAVLPIPTLPDHGVPCVDSSVAVGWPPVYCVSPRYCFL